MQDKKQLGKYYTTTNPFDLSVFKDWFYSIPNVSELTIIEPFAGSNNIVKLMNVSNDWECYDISPTDNIVPKYKIEKRDTINNFPKGSHISITNPPYLAKNSATRSGLDYAGDPYDDLYKKCLDVLLSNVDYVAAIIPESFITSGLFQDRLCTFISLTCKMFDDTECPVCLSLFSKDSTSDFKVYRMDEFLGNYKDFTCFRPVNTKLYNWTFNDPVGEIGIYCIDNTKGNTIQFIKGDNIDSTLVKPTSRSMTRVHGPEIKNIPLFLEKCNNLLSWFRNNTYDVFLTTFKGLRDDGLYRRRLDFDTARAIMETVLLHFKNELL